VSAENGGVSAHTLNEAECRDALPNLPWLPCIAWFRHLTILYRVKRAASAERKWEGGSGLIIVRDGVGEVEREDVGEAFGRMCGNTKPGAWHSQT
jgi:hypothetical protein